MRAAVSGCSFAQKDTMAAAPFLYHKIVLTGATSGIGLALLKRLHDLGYTLVAIGRDPNRLEALASQYPDVTFIRCDLTSPTELHELLDELRRHHADTTLLINNAGVQYNYQIGTEAEGAGWMTAEIQTNLTAALQLCEALLPGLRQQPEAAIVNVTSGLALSPKRSAPVYCATKAGLRLFTKALRYQLEDSTVRVVELVLPLVDTPMTAGRGRGKLSPEAVVDTLLAGLKRGKTEIYPGRAGLFRWIHRIAPEVADRILKNG